MSTAHCPPEQDDQWKRIVNCQQEDLRLLARQQKLRLARLESTLCRIRFVVWSTLSVCAFVGLTSFVLAVHAYQGEHTIVRKNGEPRAVLVPYKWWEEQQNKEEGAG